MSYSVGQVARLAGVTVRTLHHYDELGLLRPSGRTAAGYRRYSIEDLERLQQILLYRRFGFSLEKIAGLLDDPFVDPIEHLERQRELLTDQIDRLRDMVAAVNKTMKARKVGINLTPEEMFEVFGDEDPTQYADEAEERWGETDAYKESQRRTSSYTKDDWAEMGAESGEIEQRLAHAMADGHAPDSEEAMDAAEAHRRHIARWFYDCPPQMHRGLGEMYVADARFTEHYERRAAGLAQYVSAAFAANADRFEAR